MSDPSSIADAGYEVEAELAVGGFGTVYRVRDLIRRQVVALKVMHGNLVSTPDGIARFEREARIVGRVRHPNVVSLHDVGRLRTGRPYFAMELLEGEDLRQRIDRAGPVELAHATRILDAVCRALSAAHAVGVIHRDVKASNVFLSREDAGERVVLLDFGVCKLLDDTGPVLTMATHLVGTPPCMAPEQITGDDVDERTDVYALGVLAFHMLAGELPFHALNAATIQRMHLEDPPPPLPSAPPAIAEVIRRAMAKDPDDRPDDPEQLLAAWRAATT